MLLMAISNGMKGSCCQNSFLLLQLGKITESWVIVDKTYVFAAAAMV